MVQIVFIGITAALAAALLYASVISGSFISIALFYLAGSPMMIAAMGWSHLCGLIAAILAAAGLGLVFGGLHFLTFLVGIGLPAWWLSYLALLARPIRTNGTGALEWYPVGRLVVWSAAPGALLLAISLLAQFGFDEDAFRASLRRLMEALWREVSHRLVDAPPGPSIAFDVGRLIDALVVWIPRLAAVPIMIGNLFNLWLAGHVVKASGRLRRPWPDLSAMTLPRLAPLLLGVAVTGTFLEGMMSVLAWALTANLLTAYAILGLAVVHATTRAVGGRAFILGGTYLIIPLFGWPALIIALIGLADTAFDVRGRVARLRGRPPPLPPTHA